MKKILAIALAVAMMMAAFAVGASAEAAPIVFTAQSVEAEVGDIITVDIGISENHYMVNAQIWIEYDPNSLEIQEVWDDIDNPYFEEINTKIIKSNAMWAFAVPSPGTAKFAFFCRIDGFSEIKWHYGMVAVNFCGASARADNLISARKFG